MLRNAGLFGPFCSGLFCFLAACSTTYPPQDPVGRMFPSVQGDDLNEKSVQLPDIAAGAPAVFLMAFRQNSQFDVDRWLIGLNMTETDVTAYEIPTIQGLGPQMFQGFIDSGMRSGIPKELWGGVITVYGEADALHAFTGNENPGPARVLLLDASGKVVYFHDKGFSVPALNGLRDALQALSG